MKKFTKKYQLWKRSDYSYSFDEFDTIEECLLTEKYSSDWYITQWVEFEVKDITLL